MPSGQRAKYERGAITKWARFRGKVTAFAAGKYLKDFLSNQDNEVCAILLLAPLETAAGKMCLPWLLLLLESSVSLRKCQ